MALKDLSDSELGAIVRASPLWDILVSQEDLQKDEAEVIRKGQK
jgi:hypothetical protein